MTEIQNPKQKNNRFEPVWNLRPARSCLAMAGGFICNLVLEIWNLFVIWCLEFVILYTKLQGRTGEL
jgi:hypothetical protein